MAVTNQTFSTVDEVITALKNHGSLYVKCSGYREYDGRQYPNFKLVCDRLPGKQGTLSNNTQTTPNHIQTLQQKILTLIETANDIKQMIEKGIQQ